MILDTSFIIDFLRNNPPAVAKFQELYRRGVPITTTSINIFELYRGFNATQNVRVIKAYSFLDNISIYLLDISSAKRAGSIAEQLDRNGEPIEPEDAMISAIALEHSEQILTKNVKHFSRVENLVVETY